jgi:hypothetical protein
VLAASGLIEGAMLPALPVGLAVSAIIALGVIDRHRENFLRVAPSSQSGPLAPEGRASVFAVKQFWVG